jgi:catechol 2,3-dioxygenase-like lactoylglutathione lyase family enzyme
VTLPSVKDARISRMSASSDGPQASTVPAGRLAAGRSRMTAQLFFSLATDPGGRQTHVALRVGDEATVRLGHEFATAAGAEILHEPRLWPEYGPGYYAVFIRDPAGNNLELKCQADVAG